MPKTQEELVKDALDKKFDDMQSNIDTAIENGASKEDLKKLQLAAEGLKTSLDTIEEKMKNNISLKMIEEVTDKFISDNHDEIKKIEKQGHGNIEFKINIVDKAPANMTTGSALNPDGIPELIGTQIAPADNVNLRGTIVDSLVTKFSTSLSAYPYTETVPKDGDFTFLAEGEIKKQADFKIETRYASPVKIAAWVKLTTESVQDIKGLRSIATDFLRKKHALKRQSGILFGDGIAPNPKGATVYGRTFVAGSMALAVTSPTIMDIINACVTDVYTTHNYEDEMDYQPSLVCMNPVDFYLNFSAPKDGDGRPLYPTASLFNTVNIGGITVIPERSIPAGKLFVADMSKYNVTDYIGYTVKIGWVNDDFITNHFVILGESRFHAFVKNLDEQAFIYDDIATVATAITKV